MSDKILEIFHPSCDCPIRNVLSHFGDKWSLLVLVTLKSNGTMRFNDVHKSIADISQRMLTVTLRTLETNGLVSREVYPEVPPRVEYQLTDIGESLIPHIQQLINWAIEHTPQILENRKKKI